MMTKGYSVVDAGALNEVFFGSVALQKRFALTDRRFRRDGTAGYPDKVE